MFQRRTVPHVPTASPDLSTIATTATSTMTVRSHFLASSRTRLNVFVALLTLGIVWRALLIHNNDGVDGAAATILTSSRRRRGGDAHKAPPPPFLMAVLAPSAVSFPSAAPVGLATVEVPLRGAVSFYATASDFDKVQTTYVAQRSLSLNAFAVVAAIGGTKMTAISHYGARHGELAIFGVGVVGSKVRVTHMTFANPSRQQMFGHSAQRALTPEARVRLPGGGEGVVASEIQFFIYDDSEGLTLDDRDNPIAQMQQHQSNGVFLFTNMSSASPWSASLARAVETSTVWRVFALVNADCQNTVTDGEGNGSIDLVARCTLRGSVPIFEAIGGAARRRLISTSACPHTLLVVASTNPSAKEMEYDECFVPQQHLVVGEEGEAGLSVVSTVLFVLAVGVGAVLLWGITKNCRTKRRAAAAQRPASNV
eukprot:PhM_4_TR8896/c0_g1_i1/m.65040